MQGKTSVALSILKNEKIMYASCLPGVPLSFVYTQLLQSIGNKTKCTCLFDYKNQLETLEDNYIIVFILYLVIILQVIDNLERIDDRSIIEGIARLSQAVTYLSFYLTEKDQPHQTTYHFYKHYTMEYSCFTQHFLIHSAHHSL